MLQSKFERKKYARIFPHYLKSFSKYSKEKIKEDFGKMFLKNTDFFEEQAPDLLEENRAHSLLSAYSSSFKLILKANPNLFEVSCTQIQVPTCSSKSISHHPHSIQFKYYEFSLPNSKVKFLMGSLSKTPLNQSNKKGEPFFYSPFNVSSEKLEH